MSFSIEIKNEIARLESEKAENISELSAFIRNNAYIDEQIIKIYTENAAIARRIFKMIKNVYDVTSTITIRRNFNFKKNLVYILDIKDKKDMILKDLSLVNEEGYFINVPREYIYSDDEEKRSYLRGCFLASGSINNPKTSRYHLELLIDDEEYSNFINNLLNDYNLNSHIIERTNGYMIYIKEAEKISDFLRLIKAYNAVMYFEDIRIYRDHKNMINRLNNCEQANVEKVINTANKQIEEINFINEKMGIELLDDKLKETAKYRLKYPESSLLELSEIITLETNKSITKSCLNHRFRKIKEIAKQFEKNTL
ncbi:MAG: DNA-binding protein WhiA [Bacilli bacterium]|nr:DNA-binding protein WhiA [Bacilli bacterium]